MIQVSCKNRERVPVKSFPTNADGGPALLDARTGRAITATVDTGDGSSEEDPADAARLFVKPSGVDLAIGDAPRVTLFTVRGDRDLSTGEDFLLDTVELTHLPPDAPPPAVDLGLTAEPAEVQPA